MKQPIKGKRKPKKQIKQKIIVKKQEYGTSQLERDFARDFLDRMKLKYVYQFEAKEIKRFYDFAISVYNNYPFNYEDKDGIRSIVQVDRMPTISFLVEIDGDYFHSNPNVVDENRLNPMQKHNKWVDKIKNDWALMHGIPLLRIWEEDIRKHPKKVEKMLKEELDKARKKMLILENKKKPH